MLTGRDWALYELAKRQEGVVSYEQLFELGFTKPARRVKVACGEWAREAPRVVRMYWADETWLQRCWIAVLWSKGRAALSHSTAAVLHGLAFAQMEPVIHVTVARGIGRVSPAPWLVVHHSRRLLNRTMLLDLPVMSVRRTRRDLASAGQ